MSETKHDMSWYQKHDDLWKKWTKALYQVPAGEAPGLNPDCVRTLNELEAHTGSSWANTKHGESENLEG